MKKRLQKKLRRHRAAEGAPKVVVLKPRVGIRFFLESNDGTERELVPKVTTNPQTGRPVYSLGCIGTFIKTSGKPGVVI